MNNINKENDRLKAQNNVMQNIIGTDKMSEYFVERYKEDYNKDITDFDFYNLYNCEELYNKYYIELLEQYLSSDEDEQYDIKDVINHLNKSDYTILTNNGYKVVLDDDKKIYVQNFAGDMYKLSDSLESLKEDDFLTCEYILDRCEDWQI